MLRAPEAPTPLAQREWSTIALPRGVSLLVEMHRTKDALKLLSCLVDRVVGLPEQLQEKVYIRSEKLGSTKNNFFVGLAQISVAQISVSQSCLGSRRRLACP